MGVWQWKSKRLLSARLRSDRLLFHVKRIKLKTNYRCIRIKWASRFQVPATNPRPSLRRQLFPRSKTQADLMWPRYRDYRKTPCWHVLRIILLTVLTRSLRETLASNAAIRLDHGWGSKQIIKNSTWGVLCTFHIPDASRRRRPIFLAHRNWQTPPSSSCPGCVL